MNETGPHFVPIVTLCTLHLAAGLIAGLLVAASFRQRRPQVQRIARLERSLRFYRDGLARLAQQATQASLLSAGRPEPLLEAVRALAKATRDLQEQAARHSRNPKRTVPPPLAQQTEEAHAITRSEFHSLLT